MLHATLVRALLIGLAAQLASPFAVAEQWPTKGNYRFSNWAGPSLGVFFSVPQSADANSPILIVIPGARRNAEEYRDAWHDLAIANGFVTLTVEASERDFPDEFAYNAGGVTTSDGKPVAEELWTYSAIEPLFDDFRARFESQRQRYCIFGHSAGGQFVLGYLLFKPDARVVRAVAANPAFCPMPEPEVVWPFGLKGAPLPEDAVEKWVDAPLVVMLGDRDLGPRTRRLSNGPQARAQGPHVFARGLGFYNSALRACAFRQTHLLSWPLTRQASGFPT